MFAKMNSFDMHKFESPNIHMNQMAHLVMTIMVLKW